MKLPAGAGNAPAEPAMPPMAPEAEPTDDLGFGGEENPTDTAQPQGAPSSESPLDKEPFDAGIDVDEESDPKKYIEKLSGKIGQSLRDYTEKQGQPDFELEKFAINSLISATHTSEMDEEDKNDIIKKINKAGEDDSENPDMGDNNNDPNSGDDNGDGSGLGFGDDSKDDMEETRLFEEESIFLKNPKKNNMFQEGSNDILDETKPCWSGYEQIGMKKKNGKEVPNCVPINENMGESNNYMFWQNLKTIHHAVSKMVAEDDLTLNEKRSIFKKDEIKSKLQETFNNVEMSQPFVEPKTKPITKPAEPTPSRRNKPFTIEPDTIPQPDPKALNETVISEGVWNDMMKGVRQGETPFSLVAIEGNKVVGQDINIRIPDIIPAKYEAIKKQFPNAIIAIEDGTGMRVWHDKKYRK